MWRRYAIVHQIIKMCSDHIRMCRRNIFLWLLLYLLVNKWKKRRRKKTQTFTTTSAIHVYVCRPSTWLDIQTRDDPTHLSLYWRKCVVQFRFTIFFYFFFAFEHVFCDDGNVLWLKRSCTDVSVSVTVVCGHRTYESLVHNMFLIVFVLSLYRCRFIMAADENPKIN